MGNLPEGVTLPPMPEKLRLKHRRNYHGKYHTERVKNNDGQDWSANQAGYFAPNGCFANNGVSHFGQQNLLQLTNIVDIAAIGGFNPNKYLSGPPPPQPVCQFTAPQQVFEQVKTAEEKNEDDKVDQAVAEPVVEAPALVDAAK